MQDPCSATATRAIHAIIRVGLRPRWRRIIESRPVATGPGRGETPRSRCRRAETPTAGAGTAGDVSLTGRPGRPHWHEPETEQGPEDSLFRGGRDSFHLVYVSGHPSLQLHASSA
jgi:hypothetical protein